MLMLITIKSFEGVFFSFGCSMVIPALHFIRSHGYMNKMAVDCFLALALTGFFYLIGTILYVLQLPERLNPGRFDMWFGSHQLFHILIVIGCILHYYGLNKLANYRIKTNNYLLLKNEN